MTALPPLPESFGEMTYMRPGGMWGRLEGYTAKQMKAYGQACRADLEVAAKLALSALLTCPRKTREVWKDGIDIDVPSPSTKYRDDAIAALRKVGIQ